MVSTAPKSTEKLADTESCVRLTVAQATIRFLANQYVEHDGVRSKFFAGCFGIFGHGNVAGLGQALDPRLQIRAELLAPVEGVSEGEAHDAFYSGRPASIQATRRARDASSG